MEKYSSFRILTEDISKRQNSSIQSLNSLCHTTNMVYSDVSNLINDLQMIGNKQFAENRINDDDLNSATTASGCHSQQKDLSSLDSNIERQSPQELELSSILQRAFELIPKDNHHQSDLHYHHKQERSASTNSDQIKDVAVVPEIDIGVEAAPDVVAISTLHINKSTTIKDEKSPQGPTVDVIGADNNNEETSIEDTSGNTREYCSQKLYDSQQAKNLDIRCKPDVGPVNKDRVAEILKRYSLYDDDDDEDEDDNES